MKEIVLMDILTYFLLLSAAPYLISKLQHWTKVTSSISHEICENEVLHPKNSSAQSFFCLGFSKKYLCHVSKAA